MSNLYIKVRAGVRYWEDATVNGEEDGDGSRVPFRVRDDWCPVIGLGDGVIVDWPAGTTADIHYKVCDDGDYWVTDATGVLLRKWGGYYVPDVLCPEENGYGDYIILHVDGDGRIRNWRAPDLSGWPEVEP